MKKYRLIPLFVLALLAMSACQFTQNLSFLATRTPTATQTFTPTLTPTLTPTNTPSLTLTPSDTPIPPTPTNTPVPLKVGQWKGVADGWSPALTISFKLTNDGGANHIESVVIYIPNIVSGSYTTLTRCTVKVDSLEVIDNTFKFTQGSVTVFDATFIDPATVNGNIYGGWLCENTLANFGPNDSYVVWHAEWRK
jgi:hypothetical protein